uniref:C-like opsin n=1 Tax=Tripedalia cystophora TaxID=6141 RepID=A0A059NTC5_TRICY|nr:c-like opsin [Tripedalia cystophora]
MSQSCTRRKNHLDCLDKMTNYTFGRETYNAVGGFLIAVSALGGILNAFVLVFFFRLYKRERRLINILMFSTAVSDLAPSLLAYPVAGVRTIQRAPYKSHSISCKLEGFCVHLTALSSVIHLAVMAYERFSVIKSGTSKVFSVRKQQGIIFAIWMYALAVSLLPFMGWSSYEPEGLNTSCTVHWKSSNKEDVSYNIFLMFTNFIFPLFVIAISYIRLYKYVRNNSFSKRWHDSRVNRDYWKKRIQKNRALAGMVFLLISLFVVTWAPYVVISLYNIIGMPSNVNPLVETIPAILAKSFTILNPVIYGIKHHKFRAEIKRL